MVNIPALTAALRGFPLQCHDVLVIPRAVMCQWFIMPHNVFARVASDLARCLRERRYIAFGSTQEEQYYFVASSYGRATERNHRSWTDHRIMTNSEADEGNLKLMAAQISALINLMRLDSHFPTFLKVRK